MCLRSASWRFEINSEGPTPDCEQFVGLIDLLLIRLCGWGMEESLLVPEESFGRKIWEESKKIWRVAFPGIVSRVTMFGSIVMAQAFIGHISALDLAAFALVQTIGARFGNGILLGMSSATETLCGQAFGAKQYHMLGIYLQRSLIINLGTATVLLPFFIYLGPILKLIGQDAAIAEKVGTISAWFIAIMYQNAMVTTIQRYLQAQMKNSVVGWLSLFSFVIQVPMTWLFMSGLSLGVQGAMAAFVLSNWIVVVGELVYVFGGWCPGTWTGFSSAAFTDLWPVIKLSVSSGVMLCLELWYTSVLLLFAGYMKDAETSISAFSVCLNVIGLVYMVSMGFLAAASVRVSNELGRKDPKAAKFSVKVGVTTATSIGLFFSILGLVFGDDIGYLFTKDEAVVKAVSSLSLFLAVSILLNSIQPVLSGVAIGAGWQGKVAYINIVSYYVVGIPFGVLLAYVAHLDVKGIWIGMICGVATQLLVLGYIVWKTDWDDQVKQASARLQKWFLGPSEREGESADQG
uniref:Protein DETOXIFICATION n=2 Tax=Kalanchoe fedtschenkoi TaxID=63787 RepID=A0A7N0TU31_KALFE